MTKYAQGGHRQLSGFQKEYNHETLIGCGFAVAGSGEKSEKAEGPLVGLLTTHASARDAVHVLLYSDTPCSAIGRTYFLITMTEHNLA